MIDESFYTRITRCQAFSVHLNGFAAYIHVDLVICRSRVHILLTRHRGLRELFFRDAIITDPPMYKLYLRLTSGHLSWLADYARADLALEHARRLSGKLKAAVIVQFNAANSQQSQTIIFEGGRCIAHMRTSQHSSGIAGSNSGAAL